MTALLPNPEQVFLDDNGVPLAGGTVSTYIPNTLTPKATWQDAAQTISNTNPIILDSAGRAIIYGSGSYRFIVQDAASNVIYDQLTASTLSESTISDAMAPVTAAATLATARSLMGIDAYVASVVSGVTTLPGSTGPTGAQGSTGPTGPAGSSGSGSYDRQVFLTSGTWVKPGSGNIAIIQLWGAGGGASDTGAGTGGAGGGGGYTCVACLLSDLASTVTVTVGAGGVFTSGGLVGGDAGQTNFGGYLGQVGGRGGNVGYNGAQGYLVYATAINIVFGSSQQFNTSDIQYDAYGNMANTSPFSGTTGASGDAPTAWPAIFGGTGGPYGSPGTGGTTPGGGGGTNSGNGGSGRVIVTVI